MTYVWFLLFFLVELNVYVYFVIILIFIYLFISTLQVWAKELFSFTFMFSIVFVAFICLFYLLFSSTTRCTYSFRTNRFDFIYFHCYFCCFKYVFNNSYQKIVDKHMTICIDLFREDYSFERFNQRIDQFWQILNRVRHSSRIKDSHVFFSFWFSIYIDQMNWWTLK